MEKLIQVNSKGWAKSRAIAGGSSSANIDAVKGILYDVVVCQSMQPRGQAGVHYIYNEADGEQEEVRIITGQDFIERLVVLGQRQENGLQVRFGHPAMCDQVLGSYCGRVKNFRVRDNQAIGDVYLSTASENAPSKGNLKEYIINLAKEDPEAIMMSIVFTPDEPYFINADGIREIYSHEPEQDFYLSQLPEPNRVIYETIKGLHFVDFVDQGANALDLFKSSTGEPIMAARVFEFLDENPLIWETLLNQPDIVEQFTRKYESLKNSNTSNMNKNQKSPSLLAKAIQALESAFKSAEGTVATKTIEAITTDGNAISIENEGETPAVGDAVFLTGTTEPAPEGDHTLTGDLEGWLITVDAAGLISNVVDPNLAPAEEPAPIDPQMSEAVVEVAQKTAQAFSIIEKQTQLIESLSSQVKGLQSEIDVLKKSPLASRVFASSTVEVSNLGGDDEITPWEAERRRIQAAKIK